LASIYLTLLVIIDLKRKRSHQESQIQQFQDEQKKNENSVRDKKFYFISLPVKKE